jgi:hypothetical protein
VVKGQVLNMEMYRPPSPLTIDSIRQNMPQDELLFFLAKSPQDVDVWGPVSYSRAIIAQNADGIYTPLPPHDGNPGPFLLSFQADTVAQAADKAAQARSRR